MTNIAILGFGVVGSGVAEVITKNKALIEEKTGEKINIKYILDLRDFPGSPFEHLVVHDFQTILRDPEVTVVAEMMGGSHPAYDFSKACLEAGKSVVTSNKEVVSNFGAELLETAAKNKTAYLFEASVGGGIPIIRPILNDLSSNRIINISGILNGTTNYILTKMENEGAAFEDVLNDAKKKGYAEANPTADIEGIDAARKIVILAALSFGKLADPSKIHTEGITEITSDDVSIAKKMGYAVKLIGYTSVIDGKILCMVSPRLVSQANPLSGINDVFNGILVSADMVGEVMFYGPGAGKLPTASAVCADIVDIVMHRKTQMKLPAWEKASEDDLFEFEKYRCRRLFIFRSPEADSAGAVKQISDVFGSISGFVFENGKTCFISDEMSEKEAVELSGKCPLELIKMYRLL